MSSVNCQYCNSKPRLVKFGESSYVYNRNYGPIWLCSCGAYVGCHRNSNSPKGHLADNRLRKIRIIAHGLFDPIWKSGEMSRAQAYKRMAEVLNIPQKDAHISQLDEKSLWKLIRSLELRRNRNRNGIG